MKLKGYYAPFALKTIPDISYVQRDVLCIVAAFDNKYGLKQHDKAIAGQLLLKTGAINKMIRALKEGGYVRIEKAHSPYRTIWLTDKTRQIVKDYEILLRPHTPSGKTAADSTSTVESELLRPPSQSTSTRESECIGEEVSKHNTKGGKPVEGQKPFVETSTKPQESFILFWENYPKKVAKADALKAWLKLSPDQELVETIQAALDIQRQQPSWQKDNGQYVPNAATWLNGKRWNDEITQAEPEYTTREISEEEAEELERVCGI